MINWKVRIKNPTFWISAIAALALVAQTVAELRGISAEEMAQAAFENTCRLFHIPEVG